MQAFTLDVGGSGILDATANGSFAIDITGPPYFADVVGTFDDKDHRYEVSVDLGVVLKGGHFIFEHVLEDNDAVVVKTYKNASGASSFFFSGHTPLEDIEFLQLTYVDPKGKKGPVIWRSYC